MSQAFEVEASQLAGAIAGLFVRLGLPADAAGAVADDLVAADLDGIASHGVMLVPLYIERIRAGSVSLATRAEPISDRGAAIVLDAGNMLGQLSSRQAVGLAASRAGDLGLAMVTVRHAFHFGAAGRYAGMLAAAGLVGIVMSNTRPLMPAPGGAEPLVGNNPLAIALPTSGPHPVSLDMATSATAMGTIRLAAAAGASIPSNWAMDASGQPTTDPAAAIKGMLSPAAGPKGFGLAFMIDLLCGGLSGGAVGAEVRPLYNNAATPYDCSHAFLAIDPAFFADDFAGRVADRANRVSASARAPGVERVYAPGELTWSTKQASRGVCRISVETADSLRAAAVSLGADLAGLFTQTEVFSS